MTNSKLIRLIKSLSKKEMRELKNFLSSPFFNSNPSIITFFDFLDKAYPDFEKNDINKLHAYKKVYPGKTFNDNSFRNLILDLTKLIQEFLIQLELKKKTALQNQLSLEAFSNRFLKRDFDALYQKTVNSLKNKPPKDSEQFLDQYLVLKTYYHYPDTNRVYIDSTLSSKILHSLNQFFALSKLKLAIEVASRKKLLKEKAPTFFFKQYMAKYSLILPKENQPLINILLSLENFYNNHSKEQIEWATKYFKLHYRKFSFFDNKMILTVLINQMNYFFLQGNIEYLRKIHTLYQFGLDKKIITYNKRLTNSDYLNIVTTATGNKKTDWALRFIENYKNYLPEKDKEQVIALALATVQYDKGNFYKVTKLLSPFSFRKSPLGIRFRFITVKAYVELAFLDADNLKLTQTFILRMQQYIKRGAEKRATDQSIGFSNFLKIVSTILKKCTNHNKSELEKIKLLIESKSPLIAKKWLLQKVEELEQP